MQSPLHGSATALSTCNLCALHGSETVVSKRCMITAHHNKRTNNLRCFTWRFLLDSKSKHIQHLKQAQNRCQLVVLREFATKASF